MAIYMWREPSYITTAWIYRNETEGLISLSSDGSNWLTIADKNLWATTVWNSWDTLSESNCGKYYQRWNNYGFPYSWNVSTSSTQVNAGTYWPNNYYSSSVYISQSTSPYNWDSSNNENLRWWTTGTVDAMKWPCDTWFHIANKTEWDNFVSVFNSIIFSELWADLSKYLLLPFWWRRWVTGSVTNQWTDGRYWTSTRETTRPYWFTMASSTEGKTALNYTCGGIMIRPFKNVAVQPIEWDGWTSLYDIILKDINELAAMSAADAETELNKYPSNYYNKFNSEWKLAQYYWNTALSTDGTQSWLLIWSGDTIIRYYQWSWERYPL